MDDSVEKIQLTDLMQSQENSEQDDDGSKMKKESKEFDDTVINKSLEFTQQLLPNWFKEHHIQVSKDPNVYIIDILEKVYQKLPELLLEEYVSYLHSYPFLTIYITFATFPKKAGINSHTTIKVPVKNMIEI